MGKARVALCDSSLYGATKKILNDKHLEPVLKLAHLDLHDGGHQRAYPLYDGPFAFHARLSARRLIGVVSTESSQSRGKREFNLTQD